MAFQIHKTFGGMIPGRDERSLPPHAAVLARNVDLYDGKLKPIDVQAPFQYLHDTSTGELKPVMHARDIRLLSKPVAPVLVEKQKMCIPVKVPLSTPDLEDLVEAGNWIANATDGFTIIWTPNPANLVGMTTLLDYWLGWFSVITARVWITYFDTDGVFQIENISTKLIRPGTLKYTDDGFTLSLLLTSISHTFQPATAYRIYGPLFSFTFLEDKHYMGGPDQTYVFPEGGSGDHQDPQIPAFRMPLTMPIDFTGIDLGDDIQKHGDGTGIPRYQYGTLECVDYDGPVFTGPFQLPDTVTAATSVKLTESCYFNLRFKCNYIDNTKRFFHYVQTPVDPIVARGVMVSKSGTEIRATLSYGSGDLPASGKIRLRNGSGQETVFAYSAVVASGDDHIFTYTGSGYSFIAGNTVSVLDPELDEMEGPASDPSEVVDVRPGEFAKLTLTQPEGIFRRKLYRSTNRESGFALVDDEIDAATFYDGYRDGLGQELPPNGVLPFTTEADALAAGAKHPAGITFYRKDNELYPSDIDRPWVTPLEFVRAMPTDILAHIVISDTVIVWTNADTETGELGKVFAVIGQNPATLAKYERSVTAPLYDVAGLAKIGDTIFWPSLDGLMAVGPDGQVRNMTENYMTRKEWQALSPISMQAYSSGQAIYLIRANSRWHLRCEIGKGVNAITEFNVYEGGEFTWQGRTDEFPVAQTWSVAQVVAEGYPVVLTPIVDGIEQSSVMVMDSSPRTLPRMRRGRRLAVQIRGRDAVSMVGVASNLGELLVGLSQVEG